MTTIELREAAIGSGLAAELPPVSLLLEPGAPVLVPVETSERPLILSLALAGRMTVTSGSVLLDGKRDPARLRATTALVDTPFVAEPASGVPLRLVVAEELTFAGRPSRRADVAAFLDGHGLADYAHVPMRAVPARDRVLLLAELALLRPGVECLVVTSPERHGGDPAAWFGTLAAIAERGIIVVVVTDAATASTLEVTA